MVIKLQVDDKTLNELEDRLLNVSGDVPLHDRFRALFTLKAVGDARAVTVISKGFSDPSALLKHELAYVLGQISNPCAIPTLTSILEDKTQDPMVRHEAAEALGAISRTESIPLLSKYLDDAERAVRETCEIAIDKIRWDASPEGQAERLRRESERKEAEESGTIPQYTSIDPAPPSAGHSGLVSAPLTMTNDVQKLRTQLLDTSLPLFQRYRAMFALRNIGTPEAVDALADGFNDDSALFKHEVAFVFGQMSNPRSIPALLKVLQSPQEADMVRHEAAEALGGIAEVDQETTVTVDDRQVHVLDVLKDWMAKPDAPIVVQQSCQVAVDMWEYENSNQFQYANGLDSSKTGVVA